MREILIKVDLLTRYIGFMNHKMLHMISFILLAVGGLNWLLFGLLGWEIGNLFGGPDAIVSKAVYVLVGLAAIYEIATHKKNCRVCSMNTGSSQQGM